ncbi:PREDICTED: B-box zinc finger protein 23 isoform X4 [Tarenaya hassleriana]|uniref:B-box zinc finger protein 23 isoform X4 n=1 Tax=Tarenaya hassleriana TaxID=28532 RepID=UPI0008FD33A3|nr:PREDICTED: B-box zinc finger protein 23 isoform X4 [Tarenaya hassleriana]
MFYLMCSRELVNVLASAAILLWSNYFITRRSGGLFFRPINAFWAELLGELRDENFQDFAAWEGNGEFERTMLQNSSLLTFQGRTQTNPEMKIQCEVCEKAEAEVLCCSDEAVLCKSCDEKVHTANKLFQRHNRVTLLKHNSTSSGIPLCDICQERTGYVFCLEDRALLCKNCDGAIHKCTSHQRFLASGVHVSLQSCIEDSECSTSLSSSIFQIHPSGESEAGNSEVDLEKERHEGNR